MIKIYMDCVKFDDCTYIEDNMSAYEIINMEKDAFIEYIKAFAETWGDVHTCYDTFINHVGRFRRDFGKDWFGEELRFFAPEKPTDDANVTYKEYEFNDKGQLKNWPYGIFG